jgi:transposase
MRPAGSAEFLEARRLRAVQYLEQGLLPVEVARKVGVERRSVRRWKASLLKDGPKAIRAKPAPGRPARLDRERRRKLETILLKGANQAGFTTNLWTCPRVVQVIEKAFGVRYHVDHIGRILHSLGWSPQKPQRRAVERDEDRIQTWVKIDWPRVKKTPHA